MSAIDKVPSSTGSAVGSYSQGIAGIAAIVLTILGLAHVVPTYLVAIATLAVGAALITHSLSLVQEFARLVTHPAAIAEMGGGNVWSIELLGGAAGIVLGVLALLQLDPVDLVAIATIGYGGAFLISSNSTSRMTLLKVEASYGDEATRRLAGELMSSSTATQALTGLAAIVLGILALAGFSPTVLVLIALLALGTVVLLNSAALGGAVLAFFSRT
jgi:hypothetical protein